MGNSKGGYLFSEGHIGGLKLKNRIVMPPMVTRFSESGRVTGRLVNYYRRRAEGGIGLIVIEAAYVTPQIDDRLSVMEDSYIPGLQRLVEAVHGAGAMVALEINIGRGRADVHKPMAASPNPSPVTGIEPEAVSITEIKHLVHMFGKGAERAREAGFDAVMIHGSHGYLLSDFLSPRLNQRTDEYGGSLQNRARLAMELVRAVKKGNGAHYPLIFRLSASERYEGGITMEEMVELCTLLENEGVDAVDVTSGSIGSFECTVPDMSFPRAYNVDLAAEVRKSIGIPVMVAGRINHPSIGEEILRQGKADFIDFGRLSIADPDFPRKVLNGESDTIVPCIACLRCIESFRKIEGLACTMNPDVGREYTGEEQNAPVKKNVLVVGGGPAGMAAAAAAAVRGHRVTLWEKKKDLGGQLNLAVVPPFKEELLNLLSYLKQSLERFGVTVHLNTEATRENVEAFGADAIIVASGAVSSMLNIPGSESNNVVDAWDVFSGAVAPGKQVVIIGGGIVGCELAELLAPKGSRVAVVEMLPEVAADTLEILKRPLMNRISGLNIDIHTSSMVKEINDRGVVISDGEGTRRQLDADQIIIAVGSRSDRTLVDSLEGVDFEVYDAGDCRNPRRLLEALHEGSEIGRKL